MKSEKEIIEKRRCIFLACADSETRSKKLFTNCRKRLMLFCGLSSSRLKFYLSISPNRLKIVWSELPGTKGIKILHLFTNKTMNSNYLKLFIFIFYTTTMNKNINIFISNNIKQSLKYSGWKISVQWWRVSMIQKT